MRLRQAEIQVFFWIQCDMHFDLSNRRSLLIESRLFDETFLFISSKKAKVHSQLNTVGKK